MSILKWGYAMDRLADEKRNFLYPSHRYYGVFKPEYLVFNANLQEFSQRVSLICALESGAKLTPLDAFQQIHGLWEELTHCKNTLGIGDDNQAYPEI